MELYFATLSLLAVTLVASLIYYRRIKQAQGEYEGARALVEGIVLGFNRQVSRLTRSVDGVKGDALKAEIASREALRASGEALATAQVGLKETRTLTSRVEENERAVSTIKAEVQRLSKGVKLQPAKIDVESPIPLQQESVMDQLTETEVEVLTLIDELGEASAPEIRNRIEKTREHTARLLKKLYERGFIDRNTSGMPYKYYIRKEIREAIQQRKNRMKVPV